MIKTKKAISSLIATTLLLLIVVSAIGIIFSVIIPILERGLETSKKCSEISLRIEEKNTCYDKNKNSVIVAVERGFDNLELAGMQFLFETAGERKSIVIKETEQDTSLVLYFDFENNTEDKSGNGNNGILADANHDNIDGNATAKFIKTEKGIELNFDGIDDYLQTVTAPSLDISGKKKITIEAIIKLNSLPPKGYWFAPAMITEKQGSDFYDKGILVNSEGKAAFFVFDNNFRFVFSKPLEKEKFYRIVGVFDGKNIFIYVNGVLEGKENASSTQNFAQPKLVVSFSSAGTTYKYLSGAIEEIKIWNSALNEEEITEKMKEKKEILLNPGSSKSYSVPAEQIPENIAVAPLLKIGKKEILCAISSETQLKKCA